jgi:phosphonate transport system substrate-binding protein
MLQKETGRAVVFRTATDYTAVINGVRQGAIDIANLGPFAYVIAKDGGAHIVAVAARVSKKGDTPGYRSYGIVPSASPIESLAGFRGKKICFVDKKSTSGYLYPKAALAEVGINVDKDASVVFAGSHDSSALAVAKGQCDAGFAYDTMVDRQLIERGQLKPGELRVVWKSEIIPGAPMVISTDLPAALQKTLIDALQNKANGDYLASNGFCQVKCPVAGGDGYGFTAVDDAFYNPVRKFCRASNDPSCKI